MIWIIKVEVHSHTSIIYLHDSYPPENCVKMVKASRKRQKTGKIQHEQVPLGAKSALLDDASKDDEERRLESLLFGVPYAPGKSGKEILVVSDEEADDGQLEGGREFENLLDSDVCAELLKITLPHSYDL